MSEERDRCRAFFEGRGRSEFFAALEMEINATLPDHVDGENVLRIVYEAALDQAVIQMDKMPGWARAARAVKRIEEAVDDFATILRTDMGVKNVNSWTSTLKRECRRLAKSYNDESQLVADGYVTSAGGRPATTASAVAELRVLGLSRDAARGLLQAAGLTG